MKTELKFDENGFLIPHEIIETNLETMEKYFVNAFPNSKTRRIIFENYEKFLIDFQIDIFPHFEQWIGGSFISKKENPNDLDVTTFLDHKILALRGKKIDKFWKFSLEDKFIDSYIVREYPENHNDFLKFKKIQEERFELYSSTRNNIPKGLLKIMFNKKII